jgi:outer membrane immunogenic protein
MRQQLRNPRGTDLTQVNVLFAPPATFSALADEVIESVKAASGGVGRGPMAIEFAGICEDTDCTARIVSMSGRESSIFALSRQRIPGYVAPKVGLGGIMTMSYAKFGIAAILMAMAAPAAAQTTDELKARIAALENENAKLHQELSARRAPSGPRRPEARASQALATTTMPAAAYAKAPPAPLALPGSWTGFYVGGNAGLLLGKDATDSPRLHSVGAGSIRNLETFNLSPQGGLAGVQAGFNWQVSRRFVVGVEGDFQWTNANVESCVLRCLDPILSGGGLLYRQTLSSFGTFRGRAGWTNGPSLFYLTGGGAYGRVETDVTHTQPLIGHLSNVREGKSGWTAGGGLELQVAGNLTAKVEYLYLDLGKTGGQAVLNGTQPGGLVDLSTYGFSSRLHEHVFRAGLNYKLGDPIYVSALNAAGAVPAPATEWSGFYLGANGGAAVGRNPTSFANLVVVNAVIDTNDRVNTNPVGGLLGAQAGYLTKIAPNWLVGIEADWQLAQQSDPTTCFSNCASNQAVGFAFGNPSVGSQGFTQREDWLATFRARAGWTNGATLYYATGGAALGRIVTDANFLNAILSPVYTPLGNGTASIGATNWGWTAGGGIETALSANWSLKGEYLYVDLGRVSGQVLFNGGANITTISSQVRNHLFRLGVNYRTDWGEVIGLN